MKWPYMVIVAAMIWPSARGDDVTTASHIMRAALAEHAPIPSQPPAFPDRTTPGALLRNHLAANKAEADRAARRLIVKDASTAEATKSGIDNRAAMAQMMRGCSTPESADLCAGTLAADMMKSRGMIPGGGVVPGVAMPGRSSAPGGAGPAGNGMLRSDVPSQISASPAPLGSARR